MRTTSLVIAIVLTPFGAVYGLAGLAALGAMLEDCPGGKACLDMRMAASQGVTFFLLWIAAIFWTVWAFRRRRS